MKAIWQEIRMAVIYHNPRCGTSRNVLQALQDAGHQVEVVVYLKNPLSRDELARLISAAGISVRDAIRSKESVFTELGLDDPSLNDAQLPETMEGNPHLMTHPLVVSGQGTRIVSRADHVHE